MNGTSKYQAPCLWWHPETGHQCFGPPYFALDKTLHHFCNDLLHHLKAKYNLAMATLRSVDPVNRKLIYLASQGADINDLKKPVLDWSENLSGLAVESRNVTFIEDVSAKRSDNRVFAHPRLVRRLDLTSIISIPLLNTCNMNQVLLIMNLYPNRGHASLSEKDFSGYTDALAARYEAFLHDRCVRFANRLSIAIGKMKKRTPDNIYEVVARALHKAVGSSSIGIYIEKSDGNTVELQKGIGPEFAADSPSEIHKLAQDCHLGNREFLTISRIEPDVTYGGELLPSVPPGIQKTTSGVFVPLRDLAGQAKGVFCCLKGRGRSPGSEALHPFTYEDIAVIEAIGQAFAPQMEILMADYRQTESMNKLAHELRVPVVAFRAALERIRRECSEFKYTFKHKYFQELATYCGEMNRLLTDLDVVRQGQDVTPLTPRTTHIFSEIIAPAVKSLKRRLASEKLDPKSITYHGLYKSPELYLDPGMMTRVVLNLLDNAIKYSKHDPGRFRVEIVGKTTEEGFEIIFRDHGLGVPDGWEEKIFAQGVRGPNAHQCDVAGEGLGLWLARDMAQRHGANILLRNRAKPTEFVIFLPESLKNNPPQDEVI